MFSARIAALTVMVLTGLWIGSGYLHHDNGKTASARVSQAPKPLFRVVVAPVDVQPRARRLTLTGRTQSDQRVIVSARTTGTATASPISFSAALSEDGRT